MKPHVLLLILGLTAGISAATAQKKKCTNRFDTTLARTHEFSVSLGPFSGGSVWKFVTPYGRGTAFGLEYTRIFKHNHFLRSGLKGGVQGTNLGNDRSFPLQPAPEFWWNNIPSDTVLILTNTSQSVARYWGSGFVGYEYGIGRKNFRFTFGADIHIGYQYLDFRTFQNQYRQESIYDEETGMFNYNIQFLKDGSRQETGHGLFIALSPRFGIRKDFTDRFAMAATFSPQIGHYWSFRKNEIITGDNPDYFYQPKRSGISAMHAELRFIVKLGK